MNEKSSFLPTISSSEQLYRLFTKIGGKLNYSLSFETEFEGQNLRRNLLECNIQSNLVSTYHIVAYQVSSIKI